MSARTIWIRPPAPKKWRPHRWNWAWDFVQTEMSEARDVRWANSPGHSQGRYNPDRLSVWGLVGDTVKVMHFVAYCDEDYGKVPTVEVLHLHGEHYVRDDYFLAAVPKNLKWYYFGSDRTIKERSGRKRGIPLSAVACLS